MDGEIQETKIGPSERSKLLLAQLAGKELSLEEFLKECAYWAVKEGFDELKPRMIPTRPTRVVELEAKYTIKEKSEMDWAKIYTDYPEVKGYYNQRNLVENWNRGTKMWLEELLSYIPEGDYPTREKITNRLKLFNEKDELFEKVKKTFNAGPA